MIYASIHNGNATNNYHMCDVVVQDISSSISWKKVVSTHFSILFSVCSWACISLSSEYCGKIMECWFKIEVCSHFIMHYV
jgi:hypothetical protein